MSKKVIAYPKFYIKAVGGKFFVSHRLTHTYLGHADSVEELKELVEEFNSYSDKRLWNELLFKHYARLPRERETVKTFAEEENWYFEAWGMYTTHFYEEYPELLEEVTEFPHKLVNQIKRDRFEHEQALYRKGRELVKELERELDRTERKPKAEEKVIKIGDTKRLKIEAEKKKAKRIKFKKKKPGELFKTPIVSDNPFD